MSIHLTLPWPPSVNSYWRNIDGRTLISKKGREYKKAVARVVAEQRAAHHLTCPLVVEITLCPPNKVKMDIDNRLKATLDALQDAGVFEDDSQVIRLVAEKSYVITGGKAIVSIT